MSSRGMGHRIRRTASRFARGNFTYVVNPLLARLPENLRRTIFRGDRFACPLCNASLSRFLASGEGPTRANLCPICFCLTRHRVAFKVMKDYGNLFDGAPRRLLHFAPERHMADLFRGVPKLDYLSADIEAPDAMVHFDITEIPYPDRSFDAIYCSHVLEHVPDDRKAMAELRRILRPGGWALCLVPMSLEPTFEDASVVDPAERERLFGQSDHVRQYGPDFKDRLESAGFKVTVIDPANLGIDPWVANPGAISPGEVNFCV